MRWWELNRRLEANAQPVLRRMSEAGAKVNEARNALARAEFDLKASVEELGRLRDSAHEEMMCEYMAMMRRFEDRRQALSQACDEIDRLGGDSTRYRELLKRSMESDREDLLLLQHQRIRDLERQLSVARMAVQSEQELRLELEAELKATQVCDKRGALTLEDEP